MPLTRVFPHYSPFLRCWRFAPIPKAKTRGWGASPKGAYGRGLSPTSYFIKNKTANTVAT